MLDDRVSIPGRGWDIFLLPHWIHISSGAQPASYPGGTEVLFPEVKRPAREVNHSPLSRVEIKNVWSYISTPQYDLMAWCLIKQWIGHHGVVLSEAGGQNYLTFTFTHRLLIA